jgi:hypothetical protein
MIQLNIPASLIAFALLHTHAAKSVATREQHLGRVWRRHEAVAHGTRVRLQLLGKARLQHGAGLELVAQVLLLLAQHLVLQLVLQPLGDLLCYAVDVAVRSSQEQHNSRQRASARRTFG